VHAIPFLFLGVTIVAALLGEIVARVYSEPLNRMIRSHWSAKPQRAS